MRSFLGLANQLGNFHPKLSDITEPLRALLKKGAAYTWTKEQDSAFERVRAKLSNNPRVISFFKPGLPTQILSDASNLNGLGFALLQEDNNGEHKLIQCGSRSLTNEEKRYAPIELEAMGVAWAVEKCRHFLLGHPGFDIITDHRPLVGLCKRDISEIDNKILQRFRERLLPYCFEIKWREGKNHAIADSFSRCPVDKPGKDDKDQALLRFVASYDSSVGGAINTAAKDDDYKAVIQVILDRVAVTNLPPNHPGRLLANSWNLLSVSEDKKLIIFNGSRILVPKEARREVLNFLHRSHSGLVKTKKLAQELYYWPTMANDVKQKVESCEACIKLRASQQQEPIKQTVPSKPMDTLGLDLFQYAGHHYLCAFDKFTGYPWVAKLHSLTTTAVIV